jgi:dihydrofolate reductase
MRKLVIGMHVSIDGFVGNDEGILGYATTDDAVVRWVIDSLSEMDTILLGRASYEEMADYWQNATEPLATPMNSLAKVVFTSTPAEPTWSNTRLHTTTDATTEVARLKREPGKDMIVIGGAGLAQSLIAAGLVDEYRLLTHPIALGTGKPLFSKLTASLPLRLHDRTEFETGAVANVYRPR